MRLCADSSRCARFAHSGSLNGSSDSASGTLDNPNAELTMVASGSNLHPMRTVGLKVLSSKLSEYIRLAASGETVLVTDRDRVVAEIVPPRQERSPIPADALLAEEVRRGRLTPPAPANAGPPPTPAPAATLEELMAELDEHRADR